MTCIAKKRFKIKLRIYIHILLFSNKKDRYERANLVDAVEAVKAGQYTPHAASTLEKKNAK